MGTVPAKTFPAPMPFGMAPTSNVSQAQPAAQVSGPGYAAISGFDQTQQAPQSPADPYQAYAQNLFGGGGIQDYVQNMRNQKNPFLMQ